MGTFLAQSSASAGVDTSAYAQINENSQMFIIDDILAWFWCSITKCKTKEEAPAKAEPKKQPEVEVKKKEAKEDAAPSNKSNSSNSTNSTKGSDSSSTTPATPSSKPSSTPPAPAGPGAGANAGSGENNDLTPRDDTLDTIKRLKAKQDAKQGTDKIGGKEAKNADEVTRTKKDMAAGPPNEFKDETPSNAQKKATSSSVQKN